MTVVTFAVEDGSHAFRGKLLGFSTLVDFLDQNDGERTCQLELSPALRHARIICQSNSCRTGCAGWGGWSERFCTPLGVDTVCEDKITDVYHDNLIFLPTDQRGSGQFSKKCRDLNDTALSFSSSLGQSAETALPPFWINKLVLEGGGGWGGFFFCCGVNQDQTEKMPAAGGRRDLRRQVYAT